MKKFSFSVATLVVAMFVGVACTDGHDDTISKTEVVDFEEATLGSLTLEGFNPATYERVMAGKDRATLCSDVGKELYGCQLFDDILYSENGANFGAFYSDFKELWGGVFDTVYGFTISSNNDLTIATVHNQYSVYSTNNVNKFAVAYEVTWWSADYQKRYGTYDMPTIEFDAPVKPESVKVANTTYVTLQIVQNDPNMSFAMKAVGYLRGDVVAEVPIILATNSKIVTEWKTVSLKGLGKVDKICFTVDWSRTSSEVKAPAEWCPFGLCIDDLKFAK